MWQPCYHTKACLWWRQDHPTISPPWLQVWCICHNNVFQATFPYFQSICNSFTKLCNAVWSQWCRGQGGFYTKSKLCLFHSSWWRKRPWSWSSFGSLIHVSWPWFWSSKPSPTQSFRPWHSSSESTFYSSRTTWEPSCTGWTIAASAANF